METIKQRIQYIIDQYYKGNVTAFSKEVGVTQSTIRDIVKGRGNNPSSETISKILNVSALNINPDWLLTGKEPILNKDLSIIDHKRLTDNAIPYFPEVNASAGMDFLTDNRNNYSLPVSIPNVDAQAFINVFGDSMYPKYCSGEIIGIKKIEKEMVMFGHAYVVEMINGEAYIKYIDPGKDDDHWILKSENPHYKEKQFHFSKIRGVYIIKVVISKLTIK